MKIDMAQIGYYLYMQQMEDQEEARSQLHEDEEPNEKEKNDLVEGWTWTNRNRSGNI